MPPTTSFVPVDSGRGDHLPDLSVSKGGTSRQPPHDSSDEGLSLRGVRDSFHHHQRADSATAGKISNLTTTGRCGATLAGSPTRRPQPITAARKSCHRPSCSSFRTSSLSASRWPLSRGQHRAKRRTDRASYRRARRIGDASRSSGSPDVGKPYPCVTATVGMLAGSCGTSFTVTPGMTGVCGLGTRKL